MNYSKEVLNQLNCHRGNAKQAYYLSLMEGVVLLRCEISLKVICGKVKFSGCDFWNNFCDYKCTYI